jgi:tetratricopeptide (TPR) repeat protein
MNRRSRAALLLAVPFLAGWVWPWTVNRLADEGRAAYAQGDYAAAAERYRAALDARPDSPELLLNLGTSVLAQRDYARAVEILGRVRTRDPALTGQAAYNRGNALFRLNQFEAAAEAYEAALAAAPDDEDARYNLELCRDRLRRRQADAESGDQGKPQPPKPADQQQPAGAGKSGRQPGSGQRQGLSRAEVEARLEKLARAERDLRAQYFRRRASRGSDRAGLGVPERFWSGESNERDW